MKPNYQKMLEEIIASLPKDSKKRVLLHSCCGPCSTYVLKYLSQYFNIDVYFLNANIAPEEEYRLRLQAQKQVLEKSGLSDKVNLIVPPYHPDDFYRIARGLEQEPEHGKRCEKCMELRIAESAKFAAQNGYDFFCTTLSVSPHKDAALLYRLSESYSRKYDIPFLPADFKKNNGFLISTQLSKKYGIYRQNYCGCIYSKNDRADSRKLTKDGHNDMHPKS